MPSGGRRRTLACMIELTADEARALGVLIEKAFTTPDQYPLTLNAVVNGANQKNNRDPLMSLDDGRAFDALEGLRAKGLVVRADMAGSRVNKFRHQAGDGLRARPAELAILAELLLRGAQTLGELRGRASRMVAFDSLEAVKGMIDALRTREEPLVLELPPSPGSRAERYVQLLSPETAPAAGAAPEIASAPAIDAAAPAGPASPGLAARVASLESDVATLRAALQRLAASIGEPDPFGEP